MIRSKTVFTGPSAPLVATMHFQAATEDATAATAILSAVSTFWNALRPHIHIGFSYTVQQEMERLQPDGTVVGYVNASSATSSAGTNNGDPLPYQTQGMAKFRTGFFVNGREVRGRLFIPGPTETDSNTGVPATLYVTDLQTAVNNLISDANTKLSVWSRKNSLVSEVTAGVAVGQWRVLRSRR